MTDEPRGNQELDYRRSMVISKKDATTNKVAAAGQGGNAAERTPTTSSSVGHTHGIAGGDLETRPVNMSVVWIIRVK